MCQLSQYVVTGLHTWYELVLTNTLEITRKLMCVRLSETDGLNIVQDTVVFEADLHKIKSTNTIHNHA